MENNPLVPKPWWQIGLAVLPGSLFLISQIFPLTTLVDKGLGLLLFLPAGRLDWVMGWVLGGSAGPRASDLAILREQSVIECWACCSTSAAI